MTVTMIGYGFLEATCSSETPAALIHQLPKTRRAYQIDPTTMLETVASSTAQILISGTMGNSPHRQRERSLLRFDARVRAPRGSAAVLRRRSRTRYCLVVFSTLITRMTRSALSAGA